MPTYNNNEDRTSLAPHVDSVIDTFIPDHIKANYPELIAFVRAYLSYLEESSLSGYYQNTLQNQRDIRTQDQEFLRRIEQEIGLFVPQDFSTDPQIFYDRISEVWRSKGTEEGLKLFFRLFLDDPVQIRLPWEQVLIPSDGRWVIENKIRVSSISGNPEDFAGTRIFQIESFAEATVSKVERRVYSDGIIWELVLLKGSTSGEFTENNTIAIETDIDTRAEVYRSVTNINIDNAGTGYKVGDFITLDGYEGVTFTAYVDNVNEDGSITAVRIANYGSGNTPDHIRESNTEEDYYLEDFLLYEYDTDTQVGDSSLTFNVDTVSGSGASFSIDYGALITTEGQYVGVKGQLSESIVLQDSFFYQKYSYEVLTNFPISTWKGPLKRTISPAGTIPFGNIRISDTLDLSVETQQFSTITTPGIYTIEITDTLSENLVGLNQDYNNDFYFSDDYTGSTVFDETSSVGTTSSTDSFTTESI